jgi:hypothetical protein
MSCTSCAFNKKQVSLDAFNIWHTHEGLSVGATLERETLEVGKSLSISILVRNDSDSTFVVPNMDAGSRTFGRIVLSDKDGKGLLPLFEHTVHPPKEHPSDYKTIRPGEVIQTETKLTAFSREKESAELSTLGVVLITSCGLVFSIQEGSVYFISLVFENSPRSFLTREKGEVILRKWEEVFKYPAWTGHTIVSVGTLCIPKRE